MYSLIMNPGIEKEWNNDTVVVPSHKNEQFKSHCNKLKVIVPTTLTNNRFGLCEIGIDANVRGPKLL